MNLSNYSSPTVFLRGFFQRRLSVNDTDEEQCLFYIAIERAKHGRTPDEKKQKKLLFHGRKKFLTLLKKLYFQ